MTDFGSCRQFEVDATSSTDTALFGHTKLYSAPEVLMEDTKRGRPADIFSLGCVLLEIYSVYRARSTAQFYSFRKRLGNPGFSFASQEMLQEWTSSMESIDLPRFTAAGALFRKMLDVVPSQRPSADQVQLELKAYGSSCEHASSQDIFWPMSKGDEAGGDIKRVY